MSRGRHGPSRDKLGLGGVQLEAPVVHPCREASEEGLPGLVGTADGVVGEVERRHVEQTVVGISLCAAFRDGSVEDTSEGQETQGLPLSCSSSRSCIWPEQVGSVVRAAQVGENGHYGRDSSNFPREAGPVDLAKRVLQVHGEEAGQYPHSRLRSRTPAVTGWM